MSLTNTRAARHSRTLPSLFLFACLAACGGGSSGGGIPSAVDENETPPNDTPATANALLVGTPMRASVETAGDVDFFALQLVAGRTVQFELFGTRGDQPTWDTNGNVPRLTLYDTDGTSKLLEQDYTGNFSDGWSWGFHDLDIPMFQVPATGTYYVAVTQDNQAVGGGAYILRASYINLSGLQQEAEARGTSGVNDTFATAQLIHPGTVHGYHVAGELDYYSFTVSGPTVVRFEITAYRNGVHDGSSTYYDTYAYLYDSDGTTELTSNDDAFFYDSGIQYEIDTAGTYYFVVDEYDTAEGEYFLSFTKNTGDATVEAEPNDDAATANTIAYDQRRSGTVDAGETDFFKFSGHAGDMVRLQYFDSSNKQNATDGVSVYLVGTDGVTDLGWGGDDDLQTLTTILQETGTFYVRVEGNAVNTPYAIELKRFHASVYETEPNDTIAQAGTLGERVSGRIDPGGDVDLYRVSLTKDRLARLVCYASSSYTDSDGDYNYSGHGSSLAPLVEILDDQGTLVAGFTSVPANGVYTESVTQPLPTCGGAGTVDTTGTYYVRISDANGSNGASYYYVLEFERR